MERILIELDSFHHVYNRGVDKRKIFDDDEDRELFLTYLDVLNDCDIQSPRLKPELLERMKQSSRGKSLVNIIAFCLMSNHYHFLLQENNEGGISKFMQRLGTAYTMYYNQKSERTGSLFQGVYKSRLIDEESHLLKVVDYIHLNPVTHKDGVGEKVISKSLLQELRNYRWSSFADYCGKNTYPRVLNLNALSQYSEIPDAYDKWLLDEYRADDFKDVEHLKID